jgi:hypothetical protein
VGRDLAEGLELMQCGPISEAFKARDCQVATLIANAHRARTTIY